MAQSMINTFETLEALVVGNPSALALVKKAKADREELIQKINRLESDAAERILATLDYGNISSEDDYDRL